MHTEVRRNEKDQTSLYYSSIGEAMTDSTVQQKVATQEIFGNDEYVVRGGGGDFTTPGSTYQPLHADLGDSWLPGG